MAKTYRRWKDIKSKNRTRAEIAALDEEVARELLEMDLRSIRELLNKTQVDIAAALEMAQSQISRLEKQDDWLLSTLRRYVEALGGELCVLATFGDKAVRLRALDKPASDDQEQRAT